MAILGLESPPNAANTASSIVKTSKKNSKNSDFLALLKNLGKTDSKADSKIDSSPESKKQDSPEKPINAGLKPQLSAEILKVGAKTPPKVEKILAAEDSPRNFEALKSTSPILKNLLNATDLPKKNIEKMPQNLVPKMDVKKADFKEQDSPKIQQFSMNLEPQKIIKIAEKIDEKKAEKNENLLSEVLAKMPKDSTPKIEKKVEEKPAQDSPKIEEKNKKNNEVLGETLAQKNSENLATIQPPKNENLKADSPKDLNPLTPAQTPPLKPSESPQDGQKSPQMPIQNTLKNATFGALDSLDLFKPSGEKKLSEIIKKADELALNLEKIKLEKTPPIITKKSPPKINEKLKESPTESSPKITPKMEEKIAQDSPKIEPQKSEKETEKNAEINPALKNDLPPKNDEKKLEAKPKDSPLKTAEKITENNLKNAPEIKGESPKNEPQKLNEMPKDSPKIESQKEAKNEPEKIEGDVKPASFKVEGAPERETKNGAKIENKTENKIVEKPQDSPREGAFSAENAQKIEKQGEKPAASAETVRDFATRLRQEILDYKPPLTKITLELNPANLGSVEVSITHQGKNIQVSMNASQSVVNLFMQNQAELRAALSQIGYENVTMSFQSGAQGGFSDNRGEWRYFSSDERDERRRKNAEDGDEGGVFEMMIVNNYA